MAIKIPKQALQRGPDLLFPGSMTQMKFHGMGNQTFLYSKYPDAKYHDAPWRSGDVMHTLADVSRTTEVLGYTPLVRFWEGLDRTIKWYDENWDMIKKLSLKA